ncbi:MAG TPA: hypothetical protein V6C58_05460 [Allocoleopsis sp.]
MLVTIKYHDSESLTTEEVVNLAHHNYGESASIMVEADSPAPHDRILFALQQIVTPRQLVLLFDNKFTYQKDIKLLRAEVLQKLEELLDTVIIDNETKVQ